MRLFVAISLPEVVKNKLKKVITLLDKYDGIKTVETKNLHLNLEFLGQRKKPDKIIRDLKELSFTPFILETKDFGFFPNKKYIKVIWLGIKNNKDLEKLQEKVSRLTTNQKKYIPHITLARIKKINTKQKKQLLKQLKQHKTQPIKFEVKDFKLYQSKLTSIGPIYNTIQKFPANT